MKRRASKAHGKRKNLRESILIFLGMILIIFLVFTVTRAIVMKGVKKYNKNIETKTNLIIKTPKLNTSIPKKFNITTTSTKKKKNIPKKKSTPKPVPTPNRKKTPVAPAKKLALNQSKGVYYIQIGAFKSKDNAQTLITKAKSIGYKNITYTKEGNLYKVRIFGFSSRDKALSELQKLKKKGFEGFIGKK